VATCLQRTQDSSLAEEAYPAIKQFMNHLETFQNPETGLLDLPKEHWSQTAYIESSGFASRYGQSTALNATYYNTLLAASNIAEQFDDSASAAKWRRTAAQVVDSVNSLLYLPDQRRYLSSIYAGDPVAPSPHAQAWPLVYGLVPQNEIDGVAQSLEELISADPGQANIQTFGMFWVLEALGRAGHISQALDIIRLYYGYLLDHGATTWWENFLADQRQKDSFSHGWGGSPTWFLTSYVLGARELSLDYWQVKPAFDSLRFASGSLPLRNNNLEVYWLYQDCGNIHLGILSGEMTHGDIILSRTDPEIRVTLDGEIIWLAGKPLIPQVTNEADGIHIGLPGGKHDLEMQWTCQNTDLTNIFQSP
jgi:alpha-L-rhamnosidase